MNSFDEKDLHCKKVFEVLIKVGQAIVVGQDDIVGRRQLIPILSGEVIGEGFSGKVLPGGIDSQVIRPDGKCELSARYAIQMDDGAAIYIENNGMRTVPPEYAAKVIQGEFVDPALYYFRTVPVFETYDEKYKWMMNQIFLCYATRLPKDVLLKFYRVL